MSHFWRVFEKLKLAVKQCYPTGNRTKIGGKWQNSKLQMRHFEYFSNNVSRLETPSENLRYRLRNEFLSQVDFNRDFLLSKTIVQWFSISLENSTRWVLLLIRRCKRGLFCFSGFCYSSLRKYAKLSLSIWATEAPKQAASFWA